MGGMESRHRLPSPYFKASDYRGCTEVNIREKVIPLLLGTSVTTLMGSLVSLARRT